MPEPSLTNFLEARITEDHAEAQHAADENLEATWELDKIHEATRLPRPMASHIARWDPARVLAECETKRRIIERQQHAANALSQGVINPASIATLIAWTDALRLLVAKDADHPDYDETWRPE